MGQAPVTQTMTRTARRRFLSALSSLAMLGGLVGGYGAFAALAGRFLYPVPLRLEKLAVCRSGPPAENRATTCAITLRRERLSISPVRARLAALTISSPCPRTCPHLGCQVHWQAQPQRYFCPCHNGVF